MIVSVLPSTTSTGAHRFVRDVETRAIGRADDAVCNVDVVDHADHLVGRGIDDINEVAGGVGLNNACLARRRLTFRRAPSISRHVPTPP
jgi:hypothetical protein